MVLHTFPPFSSVPKTNTPQPRGCWVKPTGFSQTGFSPFCTPSLFLSSLILPPPPPIIGPPPPTPPKDSGRPTPCRTSRCLVPLFSEDFFRVGTYYSFLLSPSPDDAGKKVSCSPGLPGLPLAIVLLTKGFPFFRSCGLLPLVLKAKAFLSLSPRFDHRTYCSISLPFLSLFLCTVRSPVVVCCPRLPR